MARNKHPEVTINRIVDTATTLFMKKGYEATTIQDIINELGDLSKGAIYHHFKSKDEIVIAVAEKMYGDTNEMVMKIRDNPSLNGLEKLKQLTVCTLKNPSQKIFLDAVPNVMKNPRFFMMQMYDTINRDVPQILEPVIRQGMQDGSIVTENPRQLAEVIMLLANVWLNPVVFESTKEELAKKFHYLQKLSGFMGVPVLDDELLDVVEEYRALLEKARHRAK